MINRFMISVAALALVALIYFLSPMSLPDEPLVYLIGVNHAVQFKDWMAQLFDEPEERQTKREAFKADVAELIDTLEHLHEAAFFDVHRNLVFVFHSGRRPPRPEPTGTRRSVKLLANGASCDPPRAPEIRGQKSEIRSRSWPSNRWRPAVMCSLPRAGVDRWLACRLGPVS